ncbi:15049_t:CDS:1, partial [Cetraspora pellucida]
MGDQKSIIDDLKLKIEELKEKNDELLKTNNKSSENESNKKTNDSTKIITETLNKNILQDEITKLKNDQLVITNFNNLKHNITDYILRKIVDKIHDMVYNHINNIDKDIW